MDKPQERQLSLHRPHSDVRGFAPVLPPSQEGLQADYTKRGARRPQRMNWSNAPKRASFGHEPRREEAVTHSEGG